MGIESPVHLLFILAVALIVLGPKRLPELARAIGKGVREFRGAMEEGQNEPAERELAPAEPNGLATAQLAQPVGADAAAQPDDARAHVPGDPPGGEERSPA